jgi:serine/threonine protein phosphatase PrpC
MEHEIISGIGQRKSNEDEWTPKKKCKQSSLFLVCDGVGGENHGDDAAKITSQGITYYLSTTIHYSQKTILEALVYAENGLDLFKTANSASKNMTTTLSLLAFNSPTQAIASWVGDSRIYHIRNGEILYKSVDHSLGQLLFQKGILTEEELEKFPRKNVITKGVTGCERSAIPDFHSFEDIQLNDYFLICSDGFYEVLEYHYFSLFLAEKCVNDLKIIFDNYCLTNSNDNYTCHIVKVKGE